MLHHGTCSDPFQLSCIEPTTTVPGSEFQSPMHRPPPIQAAAPVCKGKNAGVARWDHAIRVESSQMYVSPVRITILWDICWDLV